jgi:hypothetical protein
MDPQYGPPIGAGPVARVQARDHRMLSIPGFWQSVMGTQSNGVMGPAIKCYGLLMKVAALGTTEHSLIAQAKYVGCGFFY